MAQHSYYREKKLSWMSIGFSSLMFGFYALVIGNPSMKGDRGNYALRYVRKGWDVSSESIGLNWAYELMRPISLNADFLFVTFETVYIFLTLVAYRYCKWSTPKALLLLLVSMYPMFGYYGLKQAISQGIIMIAFAIYFNQSDARLFKSAIPYIISFILVFCGILFHEAAFIIPLIIFCFIFWNNRTIRNLGYLLLFIMTLAFPLMQTVLFNNIGLLSNNLHSQITVYANGGLGSGMSFLTILKGLPFYIISYVGWKNRNLLGETIPNYDRLLLLAVFSSFTIIISAVNYWYFRFSLYFYFYVFVFATMLKECYEYNGLSIRWYKWTFIITLLLTLKDIIQYYFIYGGI